MDTSPWALLFLAGNACVLPFWGAMLLAPGSAVTRRWLRSLWICVPFAIVYAIVFAMSAGALGEVARAPSFDAIVHMIGTPAGTNLAWLHYLTGDLFIGRWIYWDSRDRSIARAWLTLVFLLGLTFCPIALLTYLVLRAWHPRTVPPTALDRRSGETTMTTPERPTPLVYLEDFLDSPDFPDNLSALTSPLGGELGLRSRVNELGVVCADVPAVAYALEAKYRRMGPFFMGHGSPAEFEEQGALVPYTTRVAFGYYRGVLIELAEPGTGSDIFQRTYDASRSTIHHLGFFARTDALTRKEGERTIDFRERLSDAGFEPRWRALVSVLGFNGRVTIFDTARVTKGVDLEFLDFRLFGRNGIKIGLPAWVVGLGARLQRAIGHPVLELPPKSD